MVLVEANGLTQSAQNPIRVQCLCLLGVQHGLNILAQGGDGIVKGAVTGRGVRGGTICKIGAVENLEQGAAAAGKSLNF